MRICLLTDFLDFNRGYSVAGVVSNLCRMFHRYGHEVHLYVGETYKDTFEAPQNAILHKSTPRFTQMDYKFEKDLTQEHKECIRDRIVPFMKSELPQYDLVITQDATFTGWLLPYFLGLEGCIEETKNTRFLHLLHSLPPRVPMKEWDWRDISRLNKYGNHKIVSFTAHNKKLIEETYKAKPEEVVVIPHIVDIRIEHDFCQESCDIIDKMPNILFGDVVCVYPASTDRLRAKQVYACIGLFDGFKRRNMRCALVIANQWATGRVPQEDKEKYINLGKGLGLKYGEEFIFTSDIDDRYNNGLSKRVLNDLYGCANLFIFPSIEESWGLVSLEGSLCGQYLVANDDVGCFHEIYGSCAHYIPFGSLEHSDFYGKSGDYVAEYLDKKSLEILIGMRDDKAIQMKTRTKCKYNMDQIYLSFYEPLLGEKL